MLKQILFILIFCSSLFAGQDSQTKTNSPLDYYNSALKLFNSDDENYDPVKALKLFRKAAEQGMSDAQFQVGWIYNAGIGVETNIAEAIKWYKKAANQNNESAQANLGLAYKYGEGVEKNLATSLFYFSQSASNGCALSQFELGWRYQDGISVTQDYKKAVEWYERAIKNGNTDALYNLAELYEKGLGASNDTIRAFMLYLDSAEHENPIAQEHVAKMYYFGNGTMRNRKKAFEWYKKAAENGVITAQGSLGYLYNYGIGVQTNYGEALKWYLKAAENGDTDSFYRIAIIYDKQKNKKAFDWFVKSAAAGDYYADFKLGYIFSEGKYTAKNLDKALEHFQKVIDSEMKEEIKGTTCLMIGGIQLKQGKTEEGFATLKKAVKYPSIKKILIVLAFVGVLGGVIFLTAMLLTLYFVLKNTKSFSSKKSWSIVEAVAVIGIFLFLQIGMSAMIVVPFFDKVCKDVFLKLLFWVFIGNGIVVLIAVLLSKIRPISVWKQFGFFKINFKKWALIVVGEFMNGYLNFSELYWTDRQFLRKFKNMIPREL